jgi:hypothetical protein
MEWAMTRAKQRHNDALDRLSAAMSESRRLGHKSREREDADPPGRTERVFVTVAAQELRIQELLETLDTATRLRLLHAHEPYGRLKTDRRARS